MFYFQTSLLWSIINSNNLEANCKMTTVILLTATPLVKNIWLFEGQKNKTILKEFYTFV